MSFHLKFLFFALILLWSLGIFVEFLIPYFNNLALFYPSLKFLYSHVCHQQPEKIISIEGHNLLVCSRCTGIYIGSLISSALILFIRINKINGIKYLLLAVTPMIVDVILYTFGFYSYSKEIAFFTGVLFGIVGIAYIYNGIQFLLIKKTE